MKFRHDPPRPGALRTRRAQGPVSSRPGAPPPIMAEDAHGILRRLLDRQHELRAIEWRDVVAEPDDLLGLHGAAVVEGFDEELNAVRGGAVPVGDGARQCGPAVSLSRLPVDHEVLIAGCDEGAKSGAREG